LNRAVLSLQHFAAYVEHQGGKRLLLNDVSLELKAGEVLALVGASGSGKSLTCSAALGTLASGVKLQAGSVLLDGREHDAQALRGRVVASIMQNPRSAFNPVHTMRRHVYETFHALSIPKGEWLPRIERALEETGLAHMGVLDLHSFQMSGGMLQRMMIALALASEAPFLFADEPTTDLDLVVQKEILHLLSYLCEKRKLGILLVTHDMGVVAAMADRVAVMDAGQIIETGAVMEVFHHPKCIETKRLIDAHLSLYHLDCAA